MNLYNHTQIDDKILEQALYKAAKAVGSTRTSKVVVKVTASSRYLGGKVQKATTGWRYYDGFLKNGRTKGEYSEDLEMFVTHDKLIPTDGGYMFLRIPATKSGFHFWDPLILAEKIYSTAAHEWRHIRDCQKNARFGQYNRNWENRPHERRANNSREKAKKLAEKRTDIQDAILALGLEIERIFKPYKEAWEEKLKKIKKKNNKR